MVHASVERCPVYGGTVRTSNAEKIRKFPGVRAVIELKPSHLTHQFGDDSGPGSRNYSCAGVAVLADTTWAAMQARKALEVEWNEVEHAQETTASLREKFVKLVSSEGTLLRSDGDFEKAHAGAPKKLEAIYEVPFLAHATMEPPNCTAHVRDGECELWAPTQIPGAAAESVAQALGIPRERVKVHVTFIGGGFGRRLIQDYAVEAALISRDAHAPVQVIWTREDDIRHDFYRPAAYHRLHAGLDPQNIGRRRRVIELAAEKSNWGKPLPKSAGRGIAPHFGYGSYVAQVAEVSCDSATGNIRIHRVTCAIDCGTAVNPLGVQAQMEGAINFGLAAALKSAITVNRGRVEQSN